MLLSIYTYEFLLFLLIIIPLKAKKRINRVVKAARGVKLGPKSHQIGPKSLKMGIFVENFIKKMLSSLYRNGFSLFLLIKMPLKAKKNINRVVKAARGVQLEPQRRQIDPKSLKKGLFVENFVKKMLLSIYTYGFLLFSLIRMPLKAKKKALIGL